MDDRSKNTLSRLPILLFELDVEGRLVLAKGGDLAKLELDAEKLLGENVCKKSSFPVKKSFFDRIKETLDTITFTYPVTRKSLIYETTLVANLNEDGSLKFVSGFAIDMTKRIAIEQAMDEENHHIAASQRLSSIAGIANGLAHEINNPLAIISGYCQLISESLEEDHVPHKTLKHAAQRAIAACDRTRAIIDCIQTFSRATSYSIFEEANLVEIVADCLKLFEARFQASHIKVERAFELEQARFYGRPVDISQALYNILENAHEALNGRKDGKIVVSLKRVERVFEIVIQDNGPGFAAQTRNKAFEPFFTTKGVGEGSGLGLSTAKGLVEGHKGSVAIESSPKGARIKILLPTFEEKSLESAS